MKHSEQLSQSRHFRLDQLADGVYAAIHVDGGWAMCNAGIVDLGDRTLIFDTFLTPWAAEDLRAAAEALTGRPVGTVINSHFHNDHIWGNQVFSAQIEIVSTAETRQSIVTEGIEAYKWYQDNAASELASLEAQYQAAEDKAHRQELSSWISYYQGLVESFPALTVRPPNVTFAERLAFYGAERRAELIACQGGHSPSDALLHLPAEGILFMGDLFFVGCHPYLGGGDPDKVVRILDMVSGFNPKALVPGHGPVGTLEDLRLLCRYINALDCLARKMVEDGEPEERVTTIGIPEPFDKWEYSSFFADSMRFFYQRQLRGQAGTIV
jgi:glyoxylase-like metal-dependent hydrolase (beta-lactamase superfamily II)